jgi:hypothetical protein
MVYYKYDDTIKFTAQLHSVRMQSRWETGTTLEHQRLVAVVANLAENIVVVIGVNFTM